MQIKEAPASKHRFRSASSEPSVGDGHDINTCSELPRIHWQMSQVLFRIYSLFVLSSASAIPECRRVGERVKETNCGVKAPAKMLQSQV